MTNLFTFNGLEGQKGTISRVCLGFVSVLSRLSLGFLSVKSWRIYAILVMMLCLRVGNVWGTDPVSSQAPSNGSSFVVVIYDGSSKYYALPNTTSNGGTLSGVEVAVNGSGEVTTSTPPTWTLEEGTGDNAGKYYLKYTSGGNTYYLYKNGTGKSNHNFAVGTSNKNYWSFSTNGTGYTVAAVDRGTNHVNIHLNSTSFECDATASAVRLLQVAAAGPTITKSSSMTTLTYSAGSPVSQSFTVGGTHLTANVRVSAPTDYEVSTNNSTFSDYVDLSYGSGTLSNTTVYIRLKAGLSGGNISSRNISLTSTGATTQTIAVTGSVPYTITWMANGNTHATTYVTVGSTLALPATDPVPNSCGCTGKAFYGWYGGGTSYENASIAPSIAAAGNTVNADKTYYAVFADASGGGTKWVLTAFASVTAGVYAIVNQTNHAFNGNVNGSGHGDCTSGTFSFTNGEATSAPDGTCEITFTAVTNGFSMYNSTYGYLYGAAASSGNLAWHNTESSYWTVYSSNWSYSTYHAYLRSYDATTGGIRTYGGNYGDGVIKLAKKVSTTTYSNYATTCCTALASINGSFF
jgi:hypothetical protein